MTRIALIGFGEAGQCFAAAADWGKRAQVFDIDPQRSRAATLSEALTGADIILSLVTADQALIAAELAAPLIAKRALFCDMNSVAPQTKRAAAQMIEAAGGRYLDVAIMAPVEPARLAVPLLLASPYADAGSLALGTLGFTSIRSVGDEVGRAATIKMLRSVMFKGLEALTAECALAAHRAGVIDEVMTSLWGDFTEKADYNLDRMLVHGSRRAAEMDEVVKTLSGLGVEAEMTRGTVVRQQALGMLGIKSPPAGLNAKLKAITA